MPPLRPDDVNALLAKAGAGTAVYLVGAGGCGMSGLAHLLLDLGFRVHGSDLAEGEEVRQLRARGAHIHAAHAADRLAAARPALLVYSSAIRADNPELRAAEQLQIPVVRRATLLAALMQRQRGICVAGMHGKTTTTALLAFALEQFGARPSYAIGALVPQLAAHARFSRGGNELPFFAAETDESDGTLREFRPEHAIVLNVDAEHLDYYANVEAIVREFGEFAAQTRGTLVFCADDARLTELFARHPGAVSFGFHPLAAYRAELKLPEGGVTRFEVWHRGLKLGDFTTALLGEKNVSNATAVIALLHQLGFAAGDIAKAIAPFRGAARRQQLLFADDRFRMFDDYGHHPREISAVLAAFRTLMPKRLLVAFQPHRYSRTQHLLAEFATCFKSADRLWLTEIYAASEPPIPGITGVTLAEAVRRGQAVEFIGEPGNLAAAVRAAMQPGDLVVFLGAGDITHAAHALARQLRAETMTSDEQICAELASRLSSAAVVRRDEPLAKRTTLRVGGRADFYVEPAGEADLAASLKFCVERGLKFTLLGRGSNLLIKDGGIRGVVICLSHPHFSRIEPDGARLDCGAGAAMKQIAIEARKAGLAGLEFIEGIPGNLGGGLRMNAGAMGAWMFDAVETLRWMDHDGQVHERPAAEINVEYRGCPMLRSAIALGAVLKGQPAEPEVIKQRMETFSHKRWETQPKQPSAGCIFKNPATIPAGKLIDELGLKGTRVGGAMVSDVHGNFIVNTGDATATDVLSLIEVIKERAKSARGIELETEVEILGE
ncbi:MAG: UDP-N-acetylmuramate--L-alanine ligase [Verrucomicrobia bacterium]|nr:UDP-N-acetylmuramate--L-alanine ligase [Verrucomicrobiota bacterium]